MSTDFAFRLARAKYRAWHRGTREADFMIGGFFDRYHRTWGEEALTWFETLLQADDVDILAWAQGTRPVPPQFDGQQMAAMQQLDYVTAH